ncbi:aldehyde dehydrogenase [Halobellus salinus]|uniref:Aldehyde dehydrogenase n=1 Tax=Halobellus salinus TaxID=931585 RepID=A0A830ERK7_9EURY|nr:aldehyde dehydrogenase family protein [Halobellus salinus]GGJ17023.1 aldehyde dehydrogenase [Halobellus salinus]SMP34397.1 aldehyde dehydrogenase (NAD+) [Halobellus salinus]
MTEKSSSEAIRERHASAQARATDDRAFAAWIDGETYETDETVSTYDPVVDEQITSVSVCDASDVEAAVEAAWDAYEGEWNGTSPPERSRLLFEWIDALKGQVDELALLECLDTGKPITDARAEVEGAIDTLEYYASACRTQTSKTIETGDNLHLYTRHEPYGVVGQITPWNFPIWAAAWKLGPALAAGNCSVLKPSATTPLTTIRMAQLSRDILPEGVINVIPGTGRKTGGPLVEHDDVRKVSFTGSVSVGEHVMKSAAEHIAPVTLELGGKSPFIVFPDADLETVVTAAADGIYYSTGEICDAFSRVLVHEDVASEFIERFVSRAKEYVLGDPLNEETTMGPLTSEEQFETVADYVDIGQEKGATLRTGGDRPSDPELADGWYVEPVVFTDVDNDMRIATEEIFGPVQTIQTFGSYEEAMKLANDTEFGLAAGIGTESTDIVHRAAADLEAGLVYVNEYGPILPDAPYGGFKQSGIGKDLGGEALDHYRQTKSVYVNLDDPTL